MSVAHPARQGERRALARACLWAASQTNASAQGPSLTLNSDAMLVEEAMREIAPKPICVKLAQLSFDNIHDKFHGLEICLMFALFILSPSHGFQAGYRSGIAVGRTRLRAAVEQLQIVVSDSHD